jgi:DNA-binding Lrp family transcriptional regulator
MPVGERKMDADDLYESDKKILNGLGKRGNATPAAIQDWTGLSGQTVHGRLNVLIAHGVIEKIHKGGLYAVVDDPRRDSVGEADESYELREQLDRAHERIEELENTAEGATDDCHEAVLEARNDLERAQNELESPTCDGEVVARHVESAVTTLDKVDV